MWKKILVGATALTITASMAALAQPQGNRGEAFRRGAPTAEDMQAFADARLAALKAGLSLTEQQAANWPAFEEAVRAWQTREPQTWAMVLDWLAEQGKSVVQV